MQKKKIELIIVKVIDLFRRIQKGLYFCDFIFSNNFDLNIFFSKIDFNFLVKENCEMYAAKLLEMDKCLNYQFSCLEFLFFKHSLFSEENYYRAKICFMVFDADIAS